MARAELKFLPERFNAANCESIVDSFLRPHGFGLLKAAAVVLAGAIAVAPPLFGQRGGGSSGGSAGGGGSHASASPGGGGGSWGGSHASGGGWHSSGGAGSSRGTSGRGVGSRISGDRSGSRGYTGTGVGRFNPSASRDMERTGQPKETGFRAAFRRLFGIKDSQPRPDDGSTGLDERTQAMVARDVERATLPPAFSGVRLSEFPALQREESLRRIPELEAPRADLRRRPMPPHPRRFGPVGIYGGWYGGYWPDFEFGFPFFLDFDYLNYCGWFGCRQRNALASPILLLYLKDGSALEVRDYWVDGVTMSYVTEDGNKGSVPVANIDIQRTTDANGRVGLEFRLDRTEPGLPLDRIEPSTVPDHENGLNPPTRTES